MSSCSVLIPAYNVEKYVARAVESALNQTYPDVEVIVINDGSTDRTAEQIAPYLDRIIYLEQDNRGLAAARNSALRRAEGDYVALLDADDLWLPQRLETMIPSLESRSDHSFVTSDAFLIYGDRVSQDRFYETLPAGRGFREENQEYWICQYNFINVMVICRRELFERHGDFDEHLTACEDWDMWIRFIQGGERAWLVKEPLSYYRWRPQSLSSDKLALSKDELLVLEKAASQRVVSGLQGRIAFAKGRFAMTEGHLSEAASFFAQAAKDRELDLPTRTRALAAARFPKISWAVYRRLVETRNRDRLDRGSV